MKKLSIVVPVYNEEKTIKKVLQTLIELPLPKEVRKEIIVINDSSTDTTAEILRQYTVTSGVIILTNKENLGKAGAVKRGIMRSTGDYVVVQDADNEYYPYDLLRLLSKMLSDDSIDAIYGNRFHKRNRNKGLNYAGNLFLTAVSNFLTAPYGLYVKDMEVCYKMIKGDLFRDIAQTLESNGFEIEPEITAKLAKSRAKVHNVDIFYYPRGHKEGKKLNSFRDGRKALLQIFRSNLFSTKTTLHKSVV